MYKVFIVEDNPDFIGLVQKYFQLQADMTLCVKTDRPERLARKTTEQPDVILLDYDLPGKGVVYNLKCLQELYPDVPILMLSIHKDEKAIVQSLYAGASGYLVKNHFIMHLREAIIQVLQGSSYLSPIAASRIIQVIRKEQPGIQIPRIIDGICLTDREFETSHHIISGKTYQETASEMNLSIETIRSYLRRLYQKLSVKNKIELIQKIERNRTTMHSGFQF